MLVRFFLFTFFSFSSYAYVQVNPVRFQVKENKFSHFTVRNTQSKTVKVEIENRYFSMKPDGQMEASSGAPDELKKILFTPKNFVLGPGEKQVVRFFVKDDLKTTELRTFAYLLTEIQDKKVEDTNAPTPAQVLTLTPKVAIAIPVVYRVQTNKENVLIANEKLEQKDKDCIFSADWNNKAHSSYINMEALDKNDKTVFTVNGVSNYLKEYKWHHTMEKVKCSDIKSFKIFDVDNDVSVVSREVKI